MSAGPWVIVVQIPQIGGSVREVLVRKSDAAEVREVLRDDPSRVERLWCEHRVREVSK